MSGFDTFWAVYGMRPIEERSIPEPNTGCWLWLGQLDKNGYPILAYKRRAGENYAHRYSLRGAIGDLGCLLALHRCDQPSCVNPSHLFAGTHQDNSDDMVKKGRYRQPRRYRGEQSATSLLTESDVVEIRRSYVKRSRDNNLSALAKRYGVAIPTIFNIINRDTWSHL